MIALINYVRVKLFILKKRDIYIINDFFYAYQIHKCMMIYQKIL